jgi:hypothetical protein
MALKNVKVRANLGPLDIFNNRPVFCAGCGQVIGNLAEAQDYDPAKWDGKPASQLLPFTARQRDLGSWLQVAKHVCKEVGRGR